MKAAVQYITLITLSLLLLTSSLNITNPPQNVTVCINNRAEINCGFTGENPELVIPNWIIFNNGRFANNETVLGPDIALNRLSGFEWMPDVNSGANNAPNSRLLFGPVNKTHNQSSFQCVFMSPVNNQIFATSSIGTVTVVGPPSVKITLDEVCVTSITLSVTIHSHSACGAFSYLVNLMSSNETKISPTSNNGFTYTFDRLTANTSYNVIVTVINDSYTSDFQVFSEMINTHSLNAPDPINISTIDISPTKNDTIRITWKKPTINACLMKEIENFVLNISCNNSESLLMTPDEPVIEFSQSDLLSNESNIHCVITIVAINIEGMRSQLSSKSFAITDDDDNSDEDGDDDDGSGGSGSGSGAGSSNDSGDDGSVTTISGIVGALISVIIIIMIAVFCFYLYRKYLRNVSAPKIQAENNSYSYCYNSSSEDTVYAISGQTTISTTSGPNSMMLQVTTQQSSSNRVHGPSGNGNKAVYYDNTGSAPPLPPKSVYADLQLANDMPKSMNLDKHVSYAEMKPV